jgi:hypothetical protein
MARYSSLLLIVILALTLSAQNLPHKRRVIGDEQRPEFNAAGMTLSNSGRQLVIGTADHRRITFAVTDSTRFSKDGADVAGSTVVANVPVQVTASQDKDYMLAAVKVEMVKEVPGWPPADSSPASQSGSASGQNPAMMALVEKARAWTTSFTANLPNFICKQNTTRYYRQDGSWQAIDIVGAQVVYEDGTEQYKQITINGRRTDKTMMDLGRGATSTGEFASVLRGLFAPPTNAQFKFYQNDTIDDVRAAIFDYTVGTWTSGWAVHVGAQELWPAYKGSVWVDRDTGEVHRIEMFGQRIPEDFPVDTMEESVDYQPVMLAGRTFFLPVRSENIMCQRGSSGCTRNVIEFRNYQKFSAQSDITFGP